MPPRELTLRGLLLGALLTIVFTASNIYLGLRIGLTFASSIPAAVISMAALRTFGGGILENNMVQTQASAAGTLSSIIFVLPGLVMIGYWQGFPFWPVATICGAGGMLGVLFTIPLRRALVTGSSLPYPEGTAAAEVLRAGSGEAGAEAGAGAESGLRALITGSAVSAGFSLLSGGLRVLGDSASLTFRRRRGGVPLVHRLFPRPGRRRLPGRHRRRPGDAAGGCTQLAGGGAGADRDHAAPGRGRHRELRHRHLVAQGAADRRRHHRHRRGVDAAEPHRAGRGRPARRPSRRQAGIRHWSPALAPATRRPTATCRRAPSSCWASSCSPAC